MAAAVPRSNPVPIEPPTATIVICPAVSWWRSPNSGLLLSGGEEGEVDMSVHTRITEEKSESKERKVLNYSSER
jgi:hypothetical protein